MPVQFLVAAQMPGYAGVQAVHGAAEVQVTPGWEVEPSQFTDCDFGGLIELNREDIGSLVHSVIVLLNGHWDKVLINPLLSPILITVIV